MGWDETGKGDRSAGEDPTWPLDGPRPRVTGAFSGTEPSVITAVRSNPPHRGHGDTGGS